MIELPFELQDALERQVEGIAPRDLGRTTRGLSDRYRAGGAAGRPVARTREDVSAYAAFRMPATYAATVAALDAVREVRPDWSPRSLLDLGAGLGAGMWAASAVWPGLERITAVESQSPMLAAGRELAQASPLPSLQGAQWVPGDVLSVSLPERYDLVLIAYVVGEIDPARLTRFIERAWSACDAVLVTIEPGTPAGAERVCRVRDTLIDDGGHPIAPCPHQPLCRAGEGDWLHFSVRLPRSKLHRAAKGAALGYEDEKFSYTALSRTPLDQSYSRIVRHPMIHKGHISLQLCTPEGRRTVVVSKRDGVLFTRARKARWGDLFELPG